MSEILAYRGVPIAPLTDAGNAERLHRRFGHLFLTTPDGEFTSWDGKRFSLDQADWFALQAAQEVTTAMRNEASAMHGASAATVRAHQRWAVRSGDLARTKAMIQSFRHLSRVASIARTTDEPETIVVGNGALRIEPARTGDGVGFTVPLRGGSASQFAFHPGHDPARRNFAASPVAFDPAADCPTWFALLDRAHPSADARRFLQVFAGVQILGHAGLPPLVSWGGLSDDREAFFAVMARLLGSYGSRVEPRAVSAMPTLAVRQEARRARGILVINAPGALRLSAASLRFWSDRVVHVDGASEPPIVPKRGQGTPPVRFLHWRSSVEDDPMSRELFNRIEDELSGVLNWALAGALAFLESGLVPPPDVTEEPAPHA